MLSHIAKSPSLRLSGLVVKTRCFQHMAQVQSLIWELSSHIKPLHALAKNKNIKKNQTKTKKQKPLLMFGQFWLLKRSFLYKAKIYFSPVSTHLSELLHNSIIMSASHTTENRYSPPIHLLLTWFSLPPIEPITLFMWLRTQNKVVHIPTEKWVSELNKKLQKQSDKGRVEAIATYLELYLMHFFECNM